MGMFTKTIEAAPAETPEAIAKHAVSSLIASNTKLQARKDNAISSFRMAANELAEVNEALAENVSIATQMRDFFIDHGNSLKKAMADNSAVRERILEIIGE